MDISSLSGRSVRDLTRNECSKLRLPRISPEKGMVVTIDESVHFTNPHQSTMMPCESACRHLSSQLFTLNEIQPNSHGAGFLFGIFSLQGLQEFNAMHEAKTIAVEV